MTRNDLVLCKCGIMKGSDLVLCKRMIVVCSVEE